MVIDWEDDSTGAGTEEDEDEPDDGEEDEGREPRLNELLLLQILEKLQDATHTLE